VWASEKEFEASKADDRAKIVGRPALPGTADAQRLDWRKAEKSREAGWESASTWLPARLRRRAFLVSRLLRVLPGSSVLELGAGSGRWTEHLSSVFAGQVSLTAAVFNEELAHKARLRNLPNTKFVCVEDIQSAFSPESFDYVVATDIPADEVNSAAVEVAFRSLKPGGQFLFFSRNHYFKPNYWDNAASGCGFTSVEVSPSEVIPPFSNAAWQAVGLILERTPLVRRLSCVVNVRGVKPGNGPVADATPVSLASHRELFGTVSVVVPCHNEEQNIDRLVKSLMGLYGDYIHEIVIVDDNSTDRTAEVATEMASTEARLKLVRRKPPAGVGRALREGYAAATGKYILSIDCDFITIAPEFKGLFDAVAEGCDGAIGSRFSSESALVGYPLLKVVCNRGYHLLLNLLLGMRVRDISNNLKLYRADILKKLDIQEDHFAANVETGLKPLLQNYRIREVPTSWINRTAEMGTSSFSLLKVGPNYLRALLRTSWRYWRGRYRLPH
jgi:SAM-dependent methyltransferase